MIPIEVLKNVKRILTHKSCPDGVASSLILHDCLPDAEIVFCQYGSSELATLKPRSGDLWVDFSPPRDRVEEWLPPNVEGTIVLDHHATAKDVVRRFGELGVYSDDPGVSGAVLAYREVWEPLRCPAEDCYGIVRAFTSLAGIRDTWQTQHPLWPESCAQAEALRFWPADHLLSLRPDQWAEAMSIGPVLSQKNRERDRKLLERSHRFGRVLCVEGCLVEDLAESLCSSDPSVHVVAGWHYFVDGGKQKLRVSMRSHVEDVSAVAKRYGGGGHRAAAGFTIDAPTGQNPYEFLESVFEP